MAPKRRVRLLHENRLRNLVEPPLQATKHLDNVTNTVRVDSKLDTNLFKTCTWPVFIASAVYPCFLMSVQ